MGPSRLCSGVGSFHGLFHWARQLGGALLAGSYAGNGSRAKTKGHGPR